jgi:hypothetical protein
LKFFKGGFLVLKFFSKNYVLAGAVIVAGTALLPLTAFAQTPIPEIPVEPQYPYPIPDSPRLSVIQGQVTNIQGNIVTVKTPDVPQYCPPGRVCATVITVGSTFVVDISRATFQSPSGTQQSPKPTLNINDAVVVAGQLGISPPVTIPNPNLPPKPFIAQVVSKLVPLTPLAIP